MTREERAIQILEQRACCRECVVSNYTCAECDEAFDTAIKALGQEPILDKIRAEVNRQYKWLIKTSYTSDIDIAFRSIFRIIDKCKAESEDKG